MIKSFFYYLILGCFLFHPLFNQESTPSSLAQTIVCGLCKDTIHPVQDGIAIPHQNETLPPCFFHTACLKAHLQKRSPMQINYCLCGQKINLKLLESEQEPKNSMGHGYSSDRSLPTLSEQDAQKLQDTMFSMIVGISAFIASGTYLLSWFM